MVSQPWGIADKYCEICMHESEHITSLELKQEAYFTKSENYCLEGLLKSHFIWSSEIWGTGSS